MEVHIEAVLEFVFFPKPSNFGVEVHTETPTGVALRVRSCAYWAACSIFQNI
jgi:hypothetical protein